MLPVSSRRQAVFVYGTLKAGASNHHWLAGALSRGRRRLIGAILHDLGPYPMAVLRPREPLVVHGELYDVDAAGLARLDVLEDYPVLYSRSLRPLSDGTTAWVYHGDAALVAEAPPLPLGDWGATPVFHYGSNLDPARLGLRCPGWDGQGLVARLPGWRWAIDKRGRRDGTGCAGIRPSPHSDTWGVVTHLNRDDLAALDGHEGVSQGHYRPTLVSVHGRCGARFPALTYVPAAAHRQEGLRPSPSYRSHILCGLEHWPLPQLWRRRLVAALANAG